MIDPVYTISVFLVLCFCSLFIYIIYVNNLLKERDSSKRQKRRKPRRKDRQYWSIDE
ncbi:hypothetical protein cmbei_5003836 [Cryptosporidium meleagridis]